MKKIIFTVIAMMTMLFFISDVKAISCNYEFSLSGKKINVSITEKFKNKNCDIKCSLAHDYSFKYNGKTVSNTDAKFNINGQTYTFEFDDFTVPSQRAGDLKKYIENTTRTCPALYFSVDNSTNYTISNNSTKNKLTTLTKPKENIETYSCTYYYDSKGEKLPYPITIQNRTNSGTYMIVNGEEIYYQSQQTKEFKNGNMTYRYAVTDKVDLSSGCDKLYGNLTKQGNVTVFTVSNGTRGNFTIYSENPTKSEQSSGSGTGSGNNGKEDINFTGDSTIDCDESLLGPETQDWLNWLFRIIQIGAPLIAVVLSMMDFLSAVVSSEDGAIKKAFKKFIKRMIAAVALIILPIIINLILDIANITGSDACNIK